MKRVAMSTICSKHKRDRPFLRSARNVNQRYMWATFLVYYPSHCCVEQIAGPMWSGPLHDSAFVGRVLEHLEQNKDQYGTAVRMKGMLTVAKEVSLCFDVLILSH